MESIIETVSITSIFAVVSAATAAYMAFRNALFHRKKQFREDYDFLQKLLVKFDNNGNDIHPLELEAGFLAYTGKCLKANEIKLLLLPTYQMLGMLGIKHYINARSLLDLSENGFSHKSEYEDTKTRRTKLGIEWGKYLICSALTYYPILYVIDYHQKISTNGMVIVAAWVSASGIAAYYYLKKISEFSSAKFLLAEKNNEEKRVKNIIYPITEEIKEN